MNRRAFLLASLALLGGCASGRPPILAPAASTLGELEPLYSAHAGREGLVVRVSSNGCTTKEDFAFYVERTGEAATLALGRKRLDPCRSFAMGHADLSFTYEGLGLDRRTPVFLLNPFAAWTGPGD